jgi:hypothetical protein
MHEGNARRAGEVAQSLRRAATSKDGIEAQSQTRQLGRFRRSPSSCSHWRDGARITHAAHPHTPYLRSSFSRAAAHSSLIVVSIIFLSRHFRSRHMSLVNSSTPRARGSAMAPRVLIAQTVS